VTLTKKGSGDLKVKKPSWSKQYPLNKIGKEKRMVKPTLNFRDQLSSDELTQIAITSKDLLVKLENVLEHPLSSSEACFQSYCLFDLAFERCHEAFGTEMTLKIVEEYRDKLHSLIKDQEVKEGVCD
jgi:hypothetical protein